MAEFEKMGKKLDDLAEKIKGITQEGVEKTGREASNWRKKLDELREKVRKTTQEGVQKLAFETKGIGEVRKLRSEIRHRREQMEGFLKELGEKTYQLHLEKKIGHMDLKKLGSRITKLRKDIETKKKHIQRLREK